MSLVQIAIAALLAAVLVGCFVVLEQMRPGSDVDLIRVGQIS